MVVDLFSIPPVSELTFILASEVVVPDMVTIQSSCVVLSVIFSFTVVHRYVSIYSGRMEDVSCSSSM